MNLEVRESGMVLERGPKNPRKRLQSAVLSLERTQGRCDNSFQKCQWMLWKRDTTNTSELLRWERAINLKCKQRQHATIRINLLMGRMDKCHKRLSRKTIKFQAVWSYNGFAGSWLCRGHPLCHQRAMEQGNVWIPYRPLADCSVLFSCVAPDKGKRNHHWACLISVLLKNWSFIWILAFCDTFVQIQDGKYWHLPRPCLGKQIWYLKIIIRFF